MPTDILDERFVERCTDIDSPEEYHTFLADVKAAAKGYNPLSVIQQFVGSSNTCVEQAKALIYLAVQDTEAVVSQQTLNRILSQDTRGGCIAAASLYSVTQRADDEAYFRELLLAPDSFTPPKASKDACYFLIKLMGVSGDTRFVDLLGEVLTKHYHFCSQYFTAMALKTLGGKVDEEEIPYMRSISVTEGRSEIIIHTDDKYTGSSNCPDCRFFPCQINRYYKGGIQDCNFWNKINPETAGEIRDQRDWGEHLASKKVEDKPPQNKAWTQACQLVAKKSYCQAIPFLCSALLLEEQWTAKSNSSILPLAWFYLSQCFSALGENEMAFIAKREALQYLNFIPESHVAVQRKLQSFDDNPVTILGQITDVTKKGYQATNHKDSNQWVNAFDCYVYENICDAGKKGGNWFEMGECHRELGEFHLAELFMRRAASITPDSDLFNTFSQGANEVHEQSLNNQDIGLSVERRKKERTPVPAKSEYGFRLDTYQFEDISQAAEQATQGCGIGDCFDLSKAAYERGDLELAIDIMKAAVNHTPFDGSKARALRMAALLQIELQAYDKAKKYLDWAIELKPEDEDIRQVQTYLAQLTSSNSF